jgi:hypothetical protein
MCGEILEPEMAFGVNPKTQLGSVRYSMGQYSVNSKAT